MWGDCAQCGHGPANTHFWNGRRSTYCEVCVVCGQKPAEHSPYGHDYRRCGCDQYQEAA